MHGKGRLSLFVTKTKNRSKQAPNMLIFYE